MLNCFPKWFHQFIFHHEQQIRATPTNILTLHHHLNIIIQIDIKQYLIMILTHTFLFTSETESLLFTSQKFFLFFFCEMPVRIFNLFFYWVMCTFITDLEVFMYFYTNPLLAILEWSCLWFFLQVPFELIKMTWIFNISLLWLVQFMV